MRKKQLQLEALETRQLLAADGAHLLRDSFEIRQNAREQTLDVLQNDGFDDDYAGEKKITHVSLGDQGGRIRVADDGASLIYAPPADRSGTERFTYFVDQDHSARVTVRISAPLQDDHLKLVPDRDAYTFDVLENDPFWEDYAGPKEITLVSASVTGADVGISEDGKSLTYTRREHYYHSDRLTYVVDNQYPATITVDFTDPLKDDNHQMVQFDPAATVNVIADDPFWQGYAGEKKITHILDVPEGASADIANDGTSIQFAPQDIAHGVYRMRYVVDDTFEAGFTVHVERPVRDDFFGVDRNSQRFEVNLLDNDDFRSIHNYRQIIDVVDRITSVGESDAGATIEITADGQGVLYTPPRDFAGNDEFTYIADGKHEATVRVTVWDPLDDSRPRVSHFRVFKGTDLNPLDVLADAFLGDGYQGARLITSVDDVEGASVQITPDRKQLLFTPGEHTYYQFSFKIDDQITAQVSVSVRSLALSETFWYSAPNTRTLRLLDRIDFPSTYVGDRVITSVEQPDQGGKVTILEGGRSVRYEPGNGDETFTYTVDGVHSGTIRIAYRQRLSSDYQVVFQNSEPQAIDVLRNDFQSHTEQRWGFYNGQREITHVEVISDNGTATISEDRKQIVYQPNEDFVGQERLRYVVDGFLETMVTIDVARLLRHDRVHVDPGSTATIDVLQNDLVGGEYQGPLLITEVSGGNVGATISVAADGKSILYQAPDNFTGQDVFEYTVVGQLKANVVVELNADLDGLYPKFASLAAFQELVLENIDLPGGVVPTVDVNREVSFDAFGQSPRIHSETNVQVEGVDEADLIETDSDYLYTLTDGQLVITKAWPADQLEVASRVDIVGSPLGMYLDGDRVAVISQERQYPIWHDDLLIDGFFRGDFSPYPVGDPTTYVTIVDVTDRSAPTLVQRTEIEGSHVQTRRIDDLVYLVVRDQQSLVPEYAQVCEGEGDEQVCRVETRAERIARVQNDFASVVEELLPNYESYGPDGELVRTGLLVQPEDIFDPISMGASSLVSVVTFDLANSEPGLASTTGVLTTGASKLYVTTDSLYVFEEQYQWNPIEVQDSPTTAIMKFDFEPAAEGVAFVATGHVPGRMLNQFSADEHDGYLRIATTITNSHTGNYSGNQENALFVLREDGGVLEHTGTLHNLALNERIQSVRFFGERAMVTTFEIIDPLFSIDLSDPTAPSVEGFLTLPGYSSYMQFVDEDHLLTIGRSTALGWGGAVAISLFDVSDMLQPVLIDQFNWGSFAHSPAETDHHAFGWFAVHDTLTIPSQRHYSVRVDEDGDGYREFEQQITEHQLHAFRIDTSPSGRDDTGISVNGTVAMDSPLIRSAFIDDKLYAIATESIKSAEINDPSNVIDEVEIRRPEGDEPDPIPEPRPLPFGAFAAAARADLATTTGVRPEEIMVVATEAIDEATRMMLRINDQHYVYEGTDDELTSTGVEYEYESGGPLQWHNTENPLDTNGDGEITPRDALVAINAINDGLVGSLPTSNVVHQFDPVFATYQIDTNNDGHATPLDVLRIIRHINEHKAQAITAADAVFAVSFLPDDDDR